MILFVILLGIGLFQKINFINTQKTQVDELYVLARACNNSAYSLSPGFSLAKERIHTLREVNSIFKPHFVNNNLFENIIYYLQA